METFREKFRSFVEEFLLVLISIYFHFFIKHKWYFFEIFEYGGMHLKTDHFKLGASLETLFKRHM